MPYGYCLQERFGKYVLTQIDGRNRKHRRGWNYKVQLGGPMNRMSSRFTSICRELYGNDLWNFDENAPENGWMVVTDRDGRICVYLHNRDQMVSIMTLLNLTSWEGIMAAA